MDESWQSMGCQPVRSSSNEPKIREQEHAQLENCFVADDGGIDGAPFGARTFYPVLHAGLHHRTDHSANDIQLGPRPDDNGPDDGRYDYGRPDSNFRIWAVHDHRDRDRPAIRNAA